MTATSQGFETIAKPSKRGIGSTRAVKLTGLALAAALGALAGFAPGLILGDSGLSESLSLVTEDRSSGSMLTPAFGGSSEPADVEADAPSGGVALFPSDETSTEDEAPAAPAIDASDALTPVDDPTRVDDPAEDATDEAGAAAAPTEADNSVDGAVDEGAEETAAPAAAPVGPTGRGQAALRLISYPWQERLPGWTISFHPEKSGLYGLTLVSEKRIEVYVRDGQSEALLAHVIAHELGHAVDVTLNDGPERRLWAETRDLDAPWWPGNGTNDFSTGAGDFAESFAAWQVGGNSFRSELGPAPDQEARDLLALLSTN